MTLQLNSKMIRLALCALVCLVSLQTWEASHDHASAAVSFECQVCSSPADLALPAPAPVAPAAVLVGQLREQSRRAGFSVTFTPYSSRAPPVTP